MFNQATGAWKVVLSVLFFPLFFQAVFLSFAWGGGNPFWIMLFKRVALLLPVLILILACWTTMASVLTVILRENRKNYITGIILCWWDFGRTIFSFWGGILRFLVYLVGTVLILIKIAVIMVWLFIQDMFFVPFRFIRSVSESMLTPGIPWIAVILTLVWTLIEATIFTYVTSPLVVDTLANVTGNQLSENFIRIPLFLFMLFIVLGSYAILANWTDTIKNKNYAAMVKIGVIELVAMFVEVVFLYREFVDALVPWFAQHSSGNFQLGITGTLLISVFTWVGVRGISWFLFASHGTPTLMAIIQGGGLKTPSGAANVQQTKTSSVPTYTKAYITHFKNEMEWVQKKGDELLAAFIMPPLQVIAAGVNFCTLLFIGYRFFQLPFKTMEEILNNEVFRQVNTKKAKGKGGENDV
ncbi:MAG: hypothetical protein JXA66_00855 [Oligoflexia bacterium]|nr:hypothetical protein [Oligoflexia bacterium]